MFATIDSARHSGNKQTYHNTQWTFKVQTIILHVKFWLYTFSNHIGPGSLWRHLRSDPTNFQHLFHFLSGTAKNKFRGSQIVDKSERIKKILKKNKRNSWSLKENSENWQNGAIFSLHPIQELAEEKKLSVQKSG